MAGASVGMTESSAVQVLKSYRPEGSALALAVLSRLNNQLKPSSATHSESQGHLGAWELGEGWSGIRSSGPVGKH